MCSLLSNVDILEQAATFAVMHCTNDLTSTCAMMVVDMLPIITTTPYQNSNVMASWQNVACHATVPKGAQAF